MDLTLAINHLTHYKWNILWASLPLVHLELIPCPCFSFHMPAETQVSEVAQLCLTLCDPMDCSLPRTSVRGIFQARVLEWVALSFSRGSSQPRDWTWVSCIVGRCFTIWVTREVLETQIHLQNPAEMPDHSNQQSLLSSELSGTCFAQLLTVPVISAGFSSLLQ